MAKNSASKMMFFLMFSLMLNEGWAEVKDNAPGKTDENVFVDLHSSIESKAFKPLSTDEMIRNVTNPGSPSLRKSSVGLKYGVYGSTIRYNSETQKIEIKKNDPYSLEEYLRNNGTITYSGNFLSDTEIDCTTKYDQFQDFTDIVGEVDKCFTKKPSILAKNSLPQDALFQMDQSVCECLYSTNNTDVTSIMNKEKDRNHGARTDSMIKNDIQKRMMDMAAKAVALQDGMMFQSHMLFYKPNETAAESSKYPAYGTPFVSQIFKSGGEAQNYINNRSREVTGLAMGMRESNNKESNRLEDKSFEALLTKEIGNISVENKTAALLSEAEFKENQCVSAKEYFSFKQFPDTNNFYKNLMNEKSFEPSKWNYISLEKELKKKRDKIPYTEQSKLEMEEIRERLRFLHRNPMLKTLMAADHDFDEYAKKTKTTKEMKAVLETTSRKILDQKKSDLFNLVKKHFTPANASCLSGSTSSCQEDVLKNVKSFDEDMKNFFSDQGVALLTKTQAEKSTFHLIDEFIEDPIPQERVPLNQSELENFVYNEVINVSPDVKAENFINPADCRAVDSSYSSRSTDYRCVMTYAVYCPVVSKAQTQLAKKIHRNEYLPPGEKVKNITYKNYFEPDIDKNPDFKAFNDAFCSIPRKGKNGKQNISFNAFRDSFCKTNRADKLCANRNYENIMALRDLFDKTHGEAVVAGGASEADIVMVNNAIRLHKDRPTSNRTQKDALAIANSDAGNIRDIRGLERFVSELQSFGGDISLPSTKSSEKFEGASMLANLTNVVESGKLNSQNAVSNSSSYNETSAYSNMVIPQQDITEIDKERVNKLPQSTREELLGQWREELNEYKKNSESSNFTSPESESGLKAKIAALEALLDQQRKLTDDQYKILNTAISNQQVAQTNPAANNQNSSKVTEEDFQEKVKVRSASGFTTMGAHGGNLAEDVFRGPASVKDPQFNSGNSSAASAGVQRSTTSSGAAASGASDSVDREVAKLVSLRRHEDGSISIDPGAKGSPLVPNAITLPVSDEQYRLLQSNPNALNLSQIEKSIPKDKLAELEKTGQIILVLQNGGNPPFEVKLEKKDNQLVYQVRDNNGQKVNPVQRIFTRQALELELKVQ